MNTRIPNLPAVNGSRGPSSALAYWDSASDTTFRATMLDLTGARYAMEYGCRGDDSNDDFPGIQQAMDEATADGGGVVVLPRPRVRYRVSRALFVPNGVTLYVPEPTTEIFAAGDAGGIYSTPNMQCAIKFGNYIDRNWEEVCTALLEPISNVTVGDRTVTLSTPANAANYPVGTVVVVRDTANTIAGGTDPEWGQHNVVTSFDAGTGVLGLRYPINRSRTSVSVVRLTNTGILSWTGATAPNRLPVENWCTRDAALIGGRWTTTTDRWPPIYLNGAVNCLIAPDSINGGINSLAWGNNIAYCEISCREVIAQRALVEMAQVSHDNRLTFQHAVLTAPSSQYLIWFPQGRNNVVRVGTINCEGPFEAGVVFTRGVGNDVEINNLTGPEAEDSVIRFTSGADMVEPTSDNRVSIRHSAVATQVRYVTFATGSSNPFPRNNRIEDTNFYGAITGNSGHGGIVCLDGERCALRDVYLENGGVVLAGGADFSDWEFSGVRCATRGGAADYNLGSGNYLFYGGMKGVTFPRHARQDAVARMFAPKSVDSSTPFSETISLPADTLSAPDALCVEILGRSAGSNGTKSLSISFAGNTIASGTIPSGTNVWRLKVTLEITANNNVTYHSEFVEGTNFTPGGGSFTGVNLSGTSYDLVLSCTVAAAGDTTTITRATVTFDSPARDRVRMLT